MKEKIKLFFKTKCDKVKEKVTKTPAYKAYRLKKKKLGKAILALILKFVDFVSPVFSFLCLKTTDKEKAIKSRNKIS